ncbi:MAG: ribosome biogenesis GTPase Der [bacterium]
MAKKSKHVPLVAIVGRPNVGKSTLFNRLVSGRRSLVDDVPGVTRDRSYGRMEWAGQLWEVIDTGGFEPETDDDILRAMRSQTELAISEADAIVFLLDGKEGLLPSDREVSERLLRQGKPVFYAVNKIDGPSHEDKAYEFYELGAERVFSVSASHGYGVDDLLDAVAEKVPGVLEAEVSEEDSEPRVAVIGRPNSGKSTLINTLLNEPRLLVHEEPGTTRDSIDTRVLLNGKSYIFIDTAGMRRKSRIDTRLERYSVSRSLKNLERCHLAVLLMDVMEGIVDQDAKLAGLAAERGRGIILAFNKWDLVEDKEAKREALETEVRLRLPHAEYAPVLTISALERKRVGKLADSIQEVMERFWKRIPTGELNRAVQEWTRTTPPPSPGGRQIKIFYGTQIWSGPPAFVFFCNHPDKIPESYQRYLVNQVRNTFDFTGVPVRVRFRHRKRRR